ncbi:MAG: glycosyltransferase family 4 protein [Paludibacteraceae bacterium]|nr:glycosyltransferase family 4 protein [Paludibacteraceae bacterium]
MKNILYISAMLPYDEAPHSSGKINSFIINKMVESGDFNVTLISNANKKELVKHSFQKHQVTSYIKIIPNYFKFFRYVFNIIFHHYSPISKWGFWGYPFTHNFYINTATHLAQIKYYYPDIVILAWVQTGFIIDKIKTIYPNAFFIVTAEDIWFQAVYRFMVGASNPFLFFIFKGQYNVTKQAEIKIWKKCNMVLCNNVKDKNMIIQSGVNINNVLRVNPYFEAKYHIRPNLNSKTILFYGNLKRRENHLSAVWFINNVFTNIISKDSTIKFILAGAQPHQELLNYKSNNIEITGFLQNTDAVFQKASIFVAPLKFGAGIKIKVLEAMSAGLPVITNTIGIEGIDAKNGIHYLHAETDKDFYNTIFYLLENRQQLMQIGENARKLTIKNHDFYQDVKNMLSVLKTKGHGSSECPPSLY